MLAVLFAVSVPPATAQPWTGGIKIGTSIATLRGSANTTFHYKASLAGGATVSYWFTDVVSVRAEILYAQRGGTTDNAIFEETETGLTADVNITYVDIPVLLVARVPVAWRVVPSIYGGGAYATNIDTAITLRRDGVIVSTNSDDSIASKDLFGIIGTTFDIDVSGQRLGLDLRAAVGTKNVRPERPDAPLRNTSFILALGIEF